MSLGFPGLWDGMESGIRVLHRGTLGTCQGCPRASWDSGMGWTVGLEPSTVGHSGHVQDVPGLPRTLEWIDSGIGTIWSGTLGTGRGCPSVIYRARPSPPAGV